MEEEAKRKKKNKKRAAVDEEQEVRDLTEDVAAVALECVGLALGGHSARVPTLSDAVDRLLDWHVGRCALFCLWIAVAARPLQRRRRWRMRRVA